MARKKTTTKKATTAKKTAPKSALRKRTVTQSTIANNPLGSFSQNTMKLRKSSVITGLIVVIIITLLYIFRSAFVVALVNGQPISRLTLYHDLEQQSGKQVLNTIITKTLIMQEATKQHVTVSQSEVDNQIKQIQQNLAKQGQKLDQVLSAQGMSRQSLQEQIRLQKLAEKMVGKNVTVSDKEVQDYIDKNKDSLPQGQDEKTMQASVRDRLKTQKLNDKFQAWLEGLQKSAKINYFVSYQ